MSKLTSAFIFATFAFLLLALNTPVQAQSNNTTYICINPANGQMRHVNSLSDCTKEEIAVPVLKGDAGQSVTSEVIVVGDARCPDGVGGVQYTDSTGIRVVCNGRRGERGERGDTGAQGPAGPAGGGAPEVYYTKTRAAGFDGTLAPTSGGFVDMATLSLPEGSYLVYAKAGLRYFPGAGVTDSSSLICKLSDGTINQEIRPRIDSPRPPGITDFFASATLPMTFGSGGGTVRWACSPTPNDLAHALSATLVQVWAIRVSAIHTQ